MKNMPLHFFLLCLIILPYRLYHVTYPIADSFNFRQTQTATFALNMYKHGVTMFRTELDIFGVGKERYLTLEFPLYEAVVAMLYKIFFFNDIWGRIVSIATGYIGAWYLMKLVILVTRNYTLGLFSAFFFLAAPLSMFYHRAFMIEATIIACLLSGLYFACLWIDSPSRNSYILGVLLLTLGFVQKGLYGPFWLLPLTVYYYRKRFKTRNTVISLIAFFAMIFIPLSALFLWQRHINIQNTANGQLFFTTDDAGHLEWNFGLLSDRLLWDMWRVRIQQIFNGILLKPGLPILVIGLWFLRRWDLSGVLLTFFASSLLYILIVFRIQAQNYYQLILVSPFAIVMAAGLYGLYRLLMMIGNRTLASLCCAMIGAVFLSRSWNSILPSFYIDWAWYERLRAVDQTVPKNTYGIFATAGNEWNSSYTYFTGHIMKQVGIEKVNSETIRQWKQEGYSFLFLHESERYADYLAQQAPEHDINFLKHLPILYAAEGIQLLSL